MANNCSNYIIISGEADNVKKATAFWKKELVEDYDKIHYLTDLSIMTAEEKAKCDVYRTIGTKWIDSSYIDEDIPDQVSITCESAWSPPLGLLKRMAEVFDVVIFCDYSEPGCNFGGKYECTKDSENDDCLTYLKYLGKYDDEMLFNELQFFIDNGELTPKHLDEVKEYITEEDYNEYLTKIKEETTNE